MYKAIEATAATTANAAANDNVRRKVVASFTDGDVGGCFTFRADVSAAQRIPQILKRCSR